MLKRFKPYLLSFILVVFAFIIAAVVDVFISIKMRDIVDVTVSGDNELFRKTAIILICLVIIILPANIIASYLKGKFIKRTLISMKNKYIKGIFKKNINEFQKDNNSMYLSSLTNDFNLIEKSMLEALLEVSYSLITFIAGIIVVSIVSPYILLIGVGVTIVNILISVLSSKPLNKHTKHRSDLFSTYTSYIKEVLSAFHIIKTNDLSDKVRNDYLEKSEKVQQKGYEIDRLMSFVFMIQRFNFNLTFMSVILFVGYLAITGDITLGGVVLIANNSNKLMWPISNISESLPKIFSVNSIFKKIDDSLVNHNNYEETISFEGLKNNIIIKDVTFGYDENDVLKNINMKFEKGKKYLIVGPSGGGKSTVLKLLRKYFHPKSGDILIDNISLKDIKKEEFFSHIANIEQHVFLFEDSIRNNLTLYKNYSDEEVMDAIKRAGLCDFIDDLSDGLDSMIYDNGKNISGGERSRIAIARGLLNKADIIFLDEAFASVDSTKAKEIEKSILELKNVTIINVSHVVFDEHKDLYNDVYIVKNKTVYN